MDEISSLGKVPQPLRGQTDGRSLGVGNAYRTESGGEALHKDARSPTGPYGIQEDRVPTNLRFPERRKPQKMMVVDWGDPA